MTNHDVLDVNAGETYTIGSGETEEWFRAEVDGTLDVDGTLKLIDNPDPPTEDEPLFTGIRELELPLSVNLPTGALNLRSMETGVSVFFAGILALLLGGWWILKNYAAGAVWSMAIVLLIISGLFGIGLEFFWLAVIGCVVLLIVGLALRAGEG